jgi:hypothetical protein
MLKKIRLTDFKSFVDEEVELAPLTLLVGANASGKSNFLDAIRFLQGLSFDLTLAEVLSGEERGWPDRWPGIRGRAEEAARFGKTAFAIESTWLAPGGELTPLNIHHSIACRTMPQAILEMESLGADFEATPAKNGTVELKSYSDRSKPSQLVPNDKSVISNPIAHTKIAVFFGQEASGSVTRVQGAFSEARLLRIEPSEMRGYGRRNAPLGEEGKNLSGVLATLCDDPATKQSFVDWLREVCAPEMEDLDFAEVKELGDVMAIFVERGNVRISARSVSDGTLRFLGTLLALRTAKPGEVLLIEDVEEGLHPTRIQFLLELMESSIRQRNIQVIATTHSPVVLQWLSPEALRDVIVFGRVPDHEGTLMRRLSDLSHFDEVIRRKGIEELFTTGWLEMAL